MPENGFYVLKYYSISLKTWNGLSVKRKSLEVLNYIFYNDFINNQVLLNSNQMLSLLSQTNTFISNQLAKIEVFYTK